jgi:hypothetical protein
MDISSVISAQGTQATELYSLSGAAVARQPAGALARLGPIGGEGLLFNASSGTLTVIVRAINGQRYG